MSSAAFDDSLGWLALIIEFPMPHGILIRRVQNGLLKEIIAHLCLILAGHRETGLICMRHIEDAVFGFIQQLAAQITVILTAGEDYQAQDDVFVLGSVHVDTQLVRRLPELLCKPQVRAVRRFRICHLRLTSHTPFNGLQ